MPSHSAQPEVATKPAPAKRMPQPPERAFLSCNSSQGADTSESVDPAANAAMIAPPCQALAESDATNKAE